MAKVLGLGKRGREDDVADVDIVVVPNEVRVKITNAFAAGFAFSFGALEMVLVVAVVMGMCGVAY